MRVPPNKIAWTADMDSFLKDNFHRMDNRQLAKALNLTLCATRTRLYLLGMKRIEMEYWTVEQLQFLAVSYQTQGDKEIAASLQANWPKGKPWTLKHVEKKRNYLGLHRTKEQLKSIKERNRKTGCWSVNHWKRWVDQQPVGTVVTWYPNVKPVQYIKTASGHRKLAHHVWQQAGNTIPKRHMIRHKDGNPLNCQLENLECISREEHGRRNTAIARDKGNNPYLNIHDKILVQWLAYKDKGMQQDLLKMPQLLQLARTNYQLKRAIKHESN